MLLSRWVNRCVFTKNELTNLILTRSSQENFTRHFTSDTSDRFLKTSWARCTPRWTLLRNKFIDRQHQIPHGSFLSRSFVCRQLSLVETVAALLPNNCKHCWMLHVAFGCTPCCMLLLLLLKPVSFPLSTAAPNIVETCCTVCTTLLTRTQQLPTLLAQRWGLLSLFARNLNDFLICILRVWNGYVQTTCKQTQQLPTLLAQQYWKLLTNNVASVCTGLY